MADPSDFIGELLGRVAVHAEDSGEVVESPLALQRRVLEEEQNGFGRSPGDELRFRCGFRFGRQWLFRIARLKLMDHAENTPARPEEPMLFCPNCNARLAAFRCKLVCEQCGYFMSCADYV